MTVRPSLTFIANEAQALSVQERRRGDSSRLIVLCLDEALFPPAEAAALLGPGVEVIGLSELGLSPRRIMEEALALADDFFPPGEECGPARVERWLIESIRRWLIYAVHSFRVVEAALSRFQPERVWLPDYRPMALTLAPDVEDSNPLFFDLVPLVCRRAQVPVTQTKKVKFNGLLRSVRPVKYVLGQWAVALKQRRMSMTGIAPRAVLVANLDNDFHRQFDLRQLGAAGTVMYAWIRNSESVVPVDQLLARVDLPETTRYGWLKSTVRDIHNLSAPAGAEVRPLSGLLHLAQTFLHDRRERARRTTELAQKYDVPWWDLLFGSGLPSIHAECRLAAAFFCVFEYERARSVLARWKPDLLVGGDYWQYLPHFAAARDLGTKTLATSAGIAFFDENVIERQSDVQCVYGQRDADIAARTNPKARIIQCGDVLSLAQDAPVVSRPPAIPPQRVLLATSARWHGWWYGSLLLDYRAYGQALAGFAERLRGIGIPVEVVIKSHPVSDLHQLYDDLIERYGDIFVEHRKEPMPESMVAEFDAGVIFSAATTFTAELIRARLPVAYFSGCLTELGRDYFHYKSLLHTESLDTLVDYLKRILTGEVLRQEAVQSAHNFLRNYVADGNRSFASVLEEVLAGASMRSLDCMTDLTRETKPLASSFPN